MAGSTTAATAQPAKSGRTGAGKRVQSSSVVRGTRTPRPAIRINGPFYEAYRVEQGIPKDEAEQLIGKVAKAAGKPLGKLRAELIPDSSWKRAGSVLGAQAGQTVARLRRVLEWAARIWDSENDAAEWLARPHLELGGATPYSLLRTEAGGRAVEAVLAALEYGFPA
jgi:putative toxin-antitoxin system antitoxin component (TIGR02293 family)